MTDNICIFWKMSTVLLAVTLVWYYLCVTFFDIEWGDWRKKPPTASTKPKELSKEGMPSESKRPIRKDHRLTFPAKIETGAKIIRKNLPPEWHITVPQFHLIVNGTDPGFHLYKNGALLAKGAEYTGPNEPFEVYHYVLDTPETNAIIDKVLAEKRRLDKEQHDAEVAAGREKQRAEKEARKAKLQEEALRALAPLLGKEFQDWPQKSPPASEE